MELKLTPKNRNLYLSQQVNQDSINVLSKEIIEINEDDEYLIKLAKINGIEYTPNPIKIYIDSYGGAVYQCFGLLGIIEKSKVPIHTIVTGCAMSCGFVIAITGHKRFAYEKSTLLYHQVSRGYVGGKAKDLEEDLVEMLRLQKLIEEHTLAKTKLTKKQLKECYDSKKDWFFTAEEALSYQIIDQII